MELSLPAGDGASEVPRTTPKDGKRASSPGRQQQPALSAAPNQVGTVVLYGVPIVSLVIEGQERLCLAQISNTLLKEFSYNEIHNRRVALGITCVQCTPVQLEILRRAGAMPVSSRRCGMITRREAERLCKSFLGDNAPPRLPDDFAFAVHHECAWGCRGSFLPSRYNSSRAKCIKCAYCGLFFSPNKFIFHSHRGAGPGAKYVQPDAANFNSWRRHMRLSGSPPEEVIHAWEDVKAMFNGGTRKRLLAAGHPQVSPAAAKQAKAAAAAASSSASPPPLPPPPPPPPRVPPPFPPDLLSRGLVVDYVWQHGVKAHHFPFPPWPWLGAAKRVAPLLGLDAAAAAGPLPPPLPPPGAGDGVRLYPSAFRPVYPAACGLEAVAAAAAAAPDSDEETVDIETTEEDDPPLLSRTSSPPCAHQDRLTGEIRPEQDADRKEEGASRSSDEASERLWTVAQLSFERPDRVLYRQEMARQLHLMRELGVQAGAEPRTYYSAQDADRRHCRLKEAHTSLQHLSSKMALDCSACHQLYSGVSLPSPESKISH